MQQIVRLNRILGALNNFLSHTPASTHHNVPHDDDYVDTRREALCAVVEYVWGE